MRRAIDSALVIIPTYDERENLLPIIDRTLAAADDLAEEIAALRSRVHVLHRERKEGLGPAYLAGIAWKWTPTARTAPRT